MISDIEDIIKLGDDSIVKPLYQCVFLATTEAGHVQLHVTDPTRTPTTILTSPLCTMRLYQGYMCLADSLILDAVVTDFTSTDNDPDDASNTDPQVPRKPIPTMPLLIEGFLDGPAIR
jgi:hypothetical protein